VKKAGLGIRGLGAGALAGIVAALIMTLVLLVLRSQLGVPTPSELAGERIAPLLSVDRFIKLLTQFGGFNNLKKIGFGSVIAGQIVVGLAGGLVYALMGRRGRRSGLLLVLIFIATLWLLSLILLWPVLGVHYYGLPPTTAALVTAFSLLTAYAIYGVALVAGHAVISKSLTGPLITGYSGRRALLVAAAGAVAGIAANRIWSRLYDIATFSYDGKEYKGDEVQFITPNERFYVVTKNVIDPQVIPELWRLEIAGMVERGHVYTYQELIDLPAIDQQTTLMCISNQVGAGLMSNAEWRGVPLRHLLERAGPKDGVSEVVMRAVDGYDDTISLAKAFEPTTLVAYGMNGDRLPAIHGYPARLIVPGLFGEKSVKWVTRIELVAHDAKGFYEKQGWGPDFNIPTRSRFDGPDFSKPILAGSKVALKGIAFGGSRGISRVEISVDDGNEWKEAKLTAVGTRLTWVLWNYDWQPEAQGEYKLLVRATDGDGTLQIREDRWTVPHGATGYHKVTAHVVA
jgi:DMSO/TMAO reductase YedYZ molybdopterin-dependent catalytic subunit